jgi:hypothetical protein
MVLADYLGFKYDADAVEQLDDSNVTTRVCGSEDVVLSQQRQGCHQSAVCLIIILESWVVSLARQAQ